MIMSGENIAIQAILRVEKRTEYKGSGKRN